MRECELCGLRARMYCESDQASLCWDCDEKVHGSNFLVAKHARSLLCHACHAPTPWKASGPKLTPTVSVCEACVDCHGRSLHAGDSDRDDGSESEESYEDNGYSDVDEDEDGENQVVPWSCSSSSPPIPDGASSSSEGNESPSRIRAREIHTDLDSDDETASSRSLRPLKRRRLSEEESTPEINRDQSESSRSTAMIASLERLQNDAVVGGDRAPATILRICKLSRDQSR